MSTQTGALRWGSTITLGQREVRVEPAVGWVVEWRGVGHCDRPWAMVEDDGKYREVIYIGDECIALDPGYADPLLLPAALLSPGERCWSEALQALAMLPDAWPDDNNGEPLLWIGLEAGSLLFDSISDEPVYHATHFGRANNYDARGRDHQREGVIRAWLTTVQARAQEGNE